MSCVAGSATPFNRSACSRHLTVGENIGLTPRLLGWEPERIEARVSELLELMELELPLAGGFPAELSGGQAQRVGLARVLAAYPAVCCWMNPLPRSIP
jgi:osmoprotectant transport system ATP-binding protein